MNLLQLLPAIRPSFPAPILIVPDRFTSFPDSLRFVLEEHSLLHVKPVVQGEVVSPGSIYLAPAEFVVTIDADQKFSVSPRYSGMFDATDRLLASAARTYGRAVAALVLTSTSITGSEGIRQLREIGGLVLTADDFVIETPVADCEKCVVDYWLPGETIPPVLESLVVERASRRE